MIALHRQDLRVQPLGVSKPVGLVTLDRSGEYLCCGWPAGGLSSDRPGSPI
jgi:hypothetical protein